ncbi:MAG: toll/interleukin-1 receptor domain-containing protein, partial [Lachnospiraceae bacterium]
MHIFISHSSKDAAVALKICELLEKNGKSCFIAPRDIRSGREYAEEIVNGIDQSEAMVLVMSANANQSPHVLREVERAVSKSIPILVYKLEEVELSKSMEYFLMTHQWVNAVAGDDYSDILDFVCNLKPEDGGTTAHNVPSDRKKHRNVLLIAAGLLLVILLAFGGYQFVSNRDTGKEICTLQVGDTVTFGSYNGEAIAWRVLQISEDGTEAVLIAKNILTMKAFDAAESGKYNYDGTTDYWSQDSP